MNTYQRIFGSGPRGALISLFLLGLAWWLEPYAGLPAITDREILRWSVFVLALIATLGLLIWSIKSLPPVERGRKLVKTGAFKYLRHPLYAAFLLFFDFGLAVLLNNWIYIFWAILLFGVWHLNVRAEERQMEAVFKDDYVDYCRGTGRFVPRLW